MLGLGSAVTDSVVERVTEALFVGVALVLLESEAVRVNVRV